MAVQLSLRGEAKGRDVTRSGDGDPFDRAVALILGPRMPGDDPSGGAPMRWRCLPPHNAPSSG